MDLFDAWPWREAAEGRAEEDTTEEEMASLITTVRKSELICLLVAMLVGEAV